MRKKGKRKRNPFPKSYLRREITLDYFESLGSRISDFGRGILTDEFKLHDFIGVVDSVFMQEDYQMSYLECVKFLDVILIQGNAEYLSLEELFEEMSLEEAV